MLFDLQASGRRRFIKVVYVFLALLIGGGLVLFGVGGSGFGLLNADQNAGSGSATGDSYQAQALSLEKKALDPKAKASASATANAWAEAAKLRFQAGAAGADSQSGAYPESSLKEFRLADQDWQQYLKTVPGQPDPILANQMTTVYGQGALNQPAEAVKAWQLVVANQATGPIYFQLAVAAFLANDDKLGERAAAKALSLTPKSQRATYEAGFKAAKAQAKAAARQAAAQAAQQQQGSGPLGATP